MKKYINKIKENKISIILVLVLFITIGIISDYYINKNKSKETRLKQELENLLKEQQKPNTENIQSFIQTSNFLEIKNKTDIKLPFVIYHEDFKIKSKTYNKEKNIELNVEGDIRIRNKQLENLQYYNIKMPKKMLETLNNIKNSFNIEKCKKLKAKQLFLYSNKGLSLTFRQQTDFIQLNVIDNQIFIWQELKDVKEDNKYLLCKYNSINLFDNISDFIDLLSNIKG